jgi:flagellin
LVFIGDKSLQQRLERGLEKATRENADSMEKLSSGTVFTRSDPRPADRALAEGLSYKIRGLAASKRNMNDAVSLLQTADDGMQQINDMVLRMKEINIAATNTTTNEHERKFLFIEYQALHDEIQRVAETTHFNGLPILNGAAENAPERLIFRMGDPFQSATAKDNDGDLNTLSFDGLKSVVTTPAGLGLKSAKELLKGLSLNEGITVEDAQELLNTEDEHYATIYDQAINTLSTMRSVYGGMQARMQRALEYSDVLSENLSAAKSNIADTDYASEVSKMASSRILMQAGTSVLAQSNFASHLTLSLINGMFNN